MQRRLGLVVCRNRANSGRKHRLANQALVYFVILISGFGLRAMIRDRKHKAR
jgi:hypothetical protein